MNSKNKIKEVRPRLAGWLYRLVRLGAAMRSITEQQWISEAITEKAKREGVPGSDKDIAA